MLETTEKDKAYDSLRAKTERSEKAKGVLRGAGYARGGGVGHAKHPDEAEDKKLIKKELKSAKIQPKKHGGEVEGKKAAARPDKMARGGSKPSGHHTRVNINVGAGQQEKQQAMQQGIQIGAKLAAAKMAGAGPRPGAGAPMQARPMPGGPGAPPPAGPPGVPPTMAQRGGRMYNRGGSVGPKKVEGVPHLDGGAGGAKGRLEKIKQYGKKRNK